MRSRVLVVVFGVVCIVGGWFQFRHNPFIGMNSRHQPVYSTSFIGAGITIILCGLIPSSWVDGQRKSPDSKR